MHASCKSIGSCLPSTLRFGSQHTDEHDCYSILNYDIQHRNCQATCTRTTILHTSEDRWWDGNQLRLNPIAVCLWSHPTRELSSAPFRAIQRGGRIQSVDAFSSKSMHLSGKQGILPIQDDGFCEKLAVRMRKSSA